MDALKGEKRKTLVPEIRTGTTEDFCQMDGQSHNVTWAGLEFTMLLQSDFEIVAILLPSSPWFEPTWLAFEFWKTKEHKKHHSPFVWG